jgi:serine-type D-Ala-D-Ala carboxypeptidase (penicillin-binding protein 5/6)
MNLYSTIVFFSAVLFAVPASAASLHQDSVPAKAAVIMDASGTILYSKYPEAKLAPASTVKLVTAMVVLDRLPLETRVRISNNAVKTRSIRPRIHRDEELTVSDLLHLALMKSINSSAVALAEAAAGTERDFVDLMNRKAEEIGAHNSLFANASGLPKGIQYSTAEDLALIMKAALSYPMIREILGKRMYVIRTSEGRDIVIDNSNNLLWRSESMIGGKTGYTGNARHCFVYAVNTDKGPLIAAVLGARSRSSLWRTAQRLTEIGLEKEGASAVNPFNHPAIPIDSENPEE